MDKNITPTTFMESFLPLNQEYFIKQIERLKVDKYTKKLDAMRFTKLLVYAQLNELDSLADISLELRTKEALQEEIGLASISDSQLSRKLRDIDPALYENALAHLMKQVQRQMGFRKATEALGQLNLIDSSTISLCLTKYRWATFRQTKAGIKLHTRIVYQDGETAPDQLILKPAKTSDRSEMDRLVVQEPGALTVHDRGYVDYRLFDSYGEQGARFVTRLRDKAIIDVLEEKVVDPSGPIVREAIVRLGNPKVYQMEHPVRLIETNDSQGNPIVIVTNDLEMDASEMSEIYRRRWQIELFFKWIKQHLQVKRLYGTSANAVYTQIRIAFITYCLLLLLRCKIAYRGSLLMVYKLIRCCWAEPLAAMIRKLYGDPTRTSAGRRKEDHERRFAETMHQYDIGEADHLNDLVYDPIY